MKKYITILTSILLTCAMAFAATTYTEEQWETNGWDLGSSIADLKEEVYLLNKLLMLSRDENIGASIGNYTIDYMGDPYSLKARKRSESNQILGQNFSNRVEIWFEKNDVNRDGGEKFDILYNDDFKVGWIFIYKVEDIADDEDPADFQHTGYRVLKWVNNGPNDRTLFKLRIYPADSPDLDSDEDSWYSASAISLKSDGRIYSYYVDFHSSDHANITGSIAFAASISETDSPYYTTIVNGDKIVSEAYADKIVMRGVFSENSDEYYGFEADGVDALDGDVLKAIYSSYPAIADVTANFDKFISMENESKKFFDSRTTCNSLSSDKNKIFYNGDVLWEFADVELP